MLAFVFPQLAHFKLMPGRQQNVQLNKRGVSGNPNPGNHKVGSSECECVKETTWYPPTLKGLVQWVENGLTAGLKGVHQWYEVHLETSWWICTPGDGSGPIGFHIFISDQYSGQMARVHILGVWEHSGSSGQCTGWLCRLPEGPRWAGEWTNRNFMETNKGKCQVQLWGRHSSMPQHRLGMISWKTALQKAPEVSGEQVEDEAAMGSDLKDQQHSELLEEEHYQPVKRGHPFSISQICHNYVEVKNYPYSFFSTVFYSTAYFCATVWWKPVLYPLQNVHRKLQYNF